MGGKVKRLTGEKYQQPQGQQNPAGGFLFLPIRSHQPDKFWVEAPVVLRGCSMSTALHDIGYGCDNRLLGQP